MANPTTQGTGGTSAGGTGGTSTQGTGGTSAGGTGGTSAGGSTATSATESQAINTAIQTLGSQIPAWCLSESSNWCFTPGVFVGLTRVNFQSGGDSFQALSGAGSGLKFRRMYLASDGTPHELIGVSLGLFYEPQSSTVGATGSTTNVQTLSTIVTLSTFENFYLGFGYRLASEATTFQRWASHNGFLVFGVGADANSLSQ